MLHRKEVTDWVRRLEKLSDGKSPREMFRDFCEMGYCAHAKLTAAGERAEQLEARYMRIVNSYPNKDTVRAFYPLLEDVNYQLWGGGKDFLGEVAAALNALDAKSGQYFTPYPVSQMMARMMLGDLSEIKSGAGYFTMNEPCVGSGSIVLATADAVEYAGHNPVDTMLVWAGDINQLAFHMCFLQLTLRGIPAYVSHQDTLAMVEPWDWAWTPASVGFFSHYGHLDFGKPEPALEKPQPEKRDDVLRPRQLRLFD